MNKNSDSNVKISKQKGERYREIDREWNHPSKKDESDCKQS